MISIVKVDGGVRSVILCDHCKQPILDARLAVALVDELGERHALHAHKGACHKEVEKTCFFRTGFLELQEHLIQLVQNSRAARPAD